MATETLKHLAKACAFIIFADGKIDSTELDSSKFIFEKYGFDWFEGETLIKTYLDKFIDASESENTAESDQDITLGNLEIDGVDCFDILKDLAKIAISDGEITFSEVSVIHLLGESFGLEPSLSSVALLNAVKDQQNLKFDLENDHE